MLRHKFSLVLCALVAATSHAAEPAHDHAAMTAPSKQMRRDMADALDKAAACMRSERPFDECKTLLAMAHAGAGADGGMQCMMDMHDKMGSKPQGGPHEH